MLDFVLDISISPRIGMNAPLSSPYVVIEIVSTKFFECPDKYWVFIILRKGGSHGDQELNN